MANPTLNQSIFQNAAKGAVAEETMSIKGTIGKTLILLLIIVLAGGYSWKVFYESTNPATITGYLWGGLIVGTILAFIISFKPNLAQYLSPVYAAAEGIALGGISAVYNFAIDGEKTGIVLPAIIITLLCAFSMLGLYNTRIIKVDNKFRRIMNLALVSVLVFYAGIMIASIFGANVSMLVGNSLLSIVISIVICAIAAFSLLTDFDMIEKGTQYGAPKYMEWYGAFALMVTLVWLYLEILKLLAKFAGRER